jgi:hypothetical protein
MIINPTLYRPDGSYIVNPHYVDYKDGAGLQIDGGDIYNKDGVHIGHCDPPGPRGEQGTAGVNDDDD